VNATVQIATVRKARTAYKRRRFVECRYCRGWGRVRTDARTRLRKRACPNCHVDPARTLDRVLKAITKDRQAELRADPKTAVRYWG
jgi:hypothetical protein